jgi:hypothetical protein
MAWVVTPALVALRAAFDHRFPSRGRHSDGSIGDSAHQRSRSGHNPDDTPGSLPESEDDDTIPEVRAIDVDANLNEAGVSMMDVIAAILRTPSDRDRLDYIIFNRTIWSRRFDWRPSTYLGDNPHYSHVHFSGNPLFDDINTPWISIIHLGKDDRMFTITGSNGTFLVTGELDPRTATPYARSITPAALADYRAAGIRHVNVPYVNPTYYSLLSGSITTPQSVQTEMVKALNNLTDALRAYIDLQK